MISATGFLATIAVLDSAHLFSPVVLSWARPELRAVALLEWRRHIVFPAALLVAVLLLPLGAVLGIYWAWNAYHYGMQNFGLMQLTNGKTSPDRRIYEGLICLVVSALGVVVFPMFFPQNTIEWLLILAAFDFDHWLCDISLATRVVRWRWVFVISLFSFGTCWLLLRHPLADQGVSIVALRCGLGMVHFVYSARVWKRDAVGALI